MNELTMETLAGRLDRVERENRGARRGCGGERWELWNNACVPVAIDACPLVVPASVGWSQN